MKEPTIGDFLGSYLIFLDIFQIRVMYQNKIFWFFLQIAINLKNYPNNHEGLVQFLVLVKH